MSTRKVKSKSLGAYLEAEHKPLPPSQQRSTAYPLEGALRSGRLREHREAAMFLSNFADQAARVDTIVRALLLYRDMIQLAEKSPGLSDKSLDELSHGEDKE